MITVLRLLFLLLVIGLVVSLTQSFQMWLAVVYVIAGVTGAASALLTNTRWTAALTGAALSFGFFWLIFVGVLAASATFSQVPFDDPAYLWALILILWISPMSAISGAIAGWFAEDLRINSLRAREVA